MKTCPNCGEENSDRARFCQVCGSALADAPTETREERKVVTVLFCDLVGFTASSDQADPEDVRARIRPYHARLRTEIERFGGTVEKFIGDAVMAVFGAPVAHEDDAERAVRAGLRILGAIEELNQADPVLGLQVRIGITTGEAVVALGARPELGEGMVTGDVVNTASRLQGVAPTGGLVVGEQTYRATSEVFDYEPLEAVTVKGKSAPISIWRAVAARSRFGTDIPRTHATAMVGREAEVTTPRPPSDGRGSAWSPSRPSPSSDEADVCWHSVIRQRVRRSVRRGRSSPRWAQSRTSPRQTTCWSGPPRSPRSSRVPCPATCLPSTLLSLGPPPSEVEILGVSGPKASVSVVPAPHPRGDELALAL